MVDVFPPRDLPGRAEEWGRQVERRIVSGESSEVQLEQKVDNGLRATGGQLAVLAEQLDLMHDAQRELEERAEISAISDSEFTASVVSNADIMTYTNSIVGVSLLDITVTQPRNIFINSNGFLSLAKLVGGGVFDAGLRLVYFTSTPTSNWSNYTFFERDVYDLRQIADPPLPHLPQMPTDFLNMTTESAVVRVLPGRYLLGLALWIGVAGGSAGNEAIAHIGGNWGLLPNTRTSFVANFSAPDPSITVSDIPQYTP